MLKVKATHQVLSPVFHILNVAKLSGIVFTKTLCSILKVLDDADTEVGKVRVMKEVSAAKVLHEENYQTAGSNNDKDCFDSDFDAATGDMMILNSSQDVIVKSNNLKACLVEKKMSEMKIKGVGHQNSVKKYVCEEDGNSKESVERKSVFALDHSIDRNATESSATNVLKNPKPRKLSPNDAKPHKSESIETVESTLPSNDKGQYTLNAGENALHNVEMKMEQAEQTVGKEINSDTNNDVCLLTSACINVVSRDDGALGVRSEQEAESDIDVKNKRTRKYVKKGKPSNEVVTHRKNVEKKQGKNRKPAKACCKQQQFSPVVVMKRLDVADYYNFESDVDKRTEKTAVDVNSDQNLKSCGRPKGSKRYAKSQSTVEEKTLKNTCTGSLFSLSDKTKHYSNLKNQNRDAVIEWENSVEDSDSYIDMKTSKPLSLANAEETGIDKENEVDFVQESQNIATKARKFACDKSLDTDLSFKESPWYKCEPQNSKYNTKWFKTYSKVRGKQRQITGGSQGIGSSGDSPTVQKFSQQMTKTLSVQMTYSSQCISSPRGDADNDPYIFDDNFSEYSNNLMLSSQQKIIKQKSVKRKRGKSNKKSTGLVDTNKKSNANKGKGSKEVFGKKKESKKVSNKRGDSYKCDSSDESSFNNYNFKNQEKSVPNLHRIEKVSQVSRRNPKSKHPETIDRQTYRHRGSDDDSDYAITCNASPVEGCDNGSMTSPVESQLNSLESWKPTYTYPLMNETKEVSYWHS